jgi:hypothetical protein
MACQTQMARAVGCTIPLVHSQGVPTQDQLSRLEQKPERAGRIHVLAIQPWAKARLQSITELLRVHLALHRRMKMLTCPGALAKAEVLAERAKKLDALRLSCFRFFRSCDTIDETKEIVLFG